MTDWIPYHDGFRGVHHSDRGGRVTVDISWKGDAGGRNATKHLKLSEEEARRLHELLGYELDSIEDDG